MKNTRVHRRAQALYFIIPLRGYIALGSDPLQHQLRQKEITGGEEKALGANEVHAFGK